MKVYTYNFFTKELKQTVELNEYEIIPAYATDLEPLPSKMGFAVCFNESKNSWEYKPDYRGKRFYDVRNKDIVGFVVDSLSFNPQNYSQSPYKLSLDEKKQVKLNELNRLFNQKLARTEIDVDGVGVVDAGERYLANANTLYELCPDDGELDFILADNSSIKIGKDKLLSIKNAIAKTGVELYAKKHELRNQILNANSIDELDKISIDL